MATLHSFPLSVKIHHVLIDFGTLDSYADGDFFYSYRMELLINGLPLLAPLSLYSWRNNEPGTIEFSQLLNFCVLVKWLDDALNGKPWTFSQLEPPQFEMGISDTSLVARNPQALNDWLNKKTGYVGLNTILTTSVSEEQHRTHFLHIEISKDFFLRSPVYKMGGGYEEGCIQLLLPTNMAALKKFRDELHDEYRHFQAQIHIMEDTAKSGSLPEWVLRYGLDGD